MTFPLTLFSQNLIESAVTVTASSSASGKPITRIYDRDRAIPWAAASAVAVDIDIDLGTSLVIGALALVDHNFPNPTTLDVYKGASSPASVLWGSPVVTVNPYFTNINDTARYWRIHIPALSGSVVPQLGEALFGVPRVLIQNPSLSRQQKIRRGNVRRDESPAGYSWAVKKGVARDRLIYGWNAVNATDLATIDGAFTETADGSKKLLVVDDENAIRWMAWQSTEYRKVPLGGGLWAIPELILEDAP